jgi:FkbM family methyltransferase
LKAIRGHALVPAARAYIRFGPAWGKEAVWRRLERRGVPHQPRGFEARTRHGVRLSGDQGWIMPRCIYWFGHWEPLLSAWLARSLRPGDTFVDVGANLGYFSLLGARRVGGSGSVLALEPSAATRSRLTENLARNRATNVSVRPEAASAAPGRIPLFRAPWNDAESSTVRRDGLVLEAEVAAVPLYELIDDQQAASLRLVKIDVEGAEVEVLRGLEPLLPLAPEAEVVIEVHPDALASQGCSAEDLVAILEPGGYRPYWLPVDFSEEAHLRPPDLRRPIAGRPPLDELVHLILSRRREGPVPLA